MSDQNYTWWKVSTEQKKSVWEHMLFEKDGMVIRYITGYRFGAVYLGTEDSNPPILEQNSGPTADMVDMFATEYEYDLEGMYDGWYAETIFPDDMSEEDQEALQFIIDESVFDLEENGWILTDTECWFEGPLFNGMCKTR
jgi:hypothetical protein